MKNQLMQAAIQYANGLRERARNLKKTVVDLELKTLEAKAHLHATDLAIDRLDSFRPDIGGELQCPACWMTHETTTPLIAQPSDTSDDWFKCRVCGFDLKIPA